MCLPLSKNSSKNSLNVPQNIEFAYIYIEKVKTNMWHTPIDHLFPK